MALRWVTTAPRGALVDPDVYCISRISDGVLGMAAPEHPTIVSVGIQQSFANGLVGERASSVAEYSADRSRTAVLASACCAPASLAIWMRRDQPTLRLDRCGGGAGTGTIPARMQAKNA